MKRFLSGCLLLLALLTAAAPETPEPVTAGYTSPILAIPRLSTPPVIDGVIDADEWRRAACVNALKTTRGAVSNRETCYWLAWDEQALYLAMRSWLREGERPITRYRGEEGDPFVVTDDSYELYFDVGGTLAGGLPAYTQYIGNFAGMKYDCAHLPTIGSRRMSYEADWAPRSRLVALPPGRAWEMEVRIPHGSILKPTPFRAGDEVRALLARNYKRPWEQNSIEGTARFGDTASYTRLNLVQDRPAVRILGVGDPARRSLGLKLEASGHGDGAVIWRMLSDAGIAREGTIQVVDGQLVIGVDDLAMDPLDQPATLPKGRQDAGHLRLQVLDARDRLVLFDWAAGRSFGGAKPTGDTFPDDGGDQVQLNLAFNPVNEYLRVNGDFINYDRRDRIAHYRVTVRDTADQVLADQELHIDDVAYVRDVLRLPGLAPGTYTARLVCTDAAGATLVDEATTFEKKDEAKAYPWWRTPKGNIERVIPPWTPVTWQDGKLGMWGRSLTVGAAGLPASVRTQEQELLAAPSRLEATLADGATIVAGAATVALVSQADHRVVLDAASQLGDIAVNSRVEAEFDGMYKVTLTLAPALATPVKGLRLVVPFQPAAATYLTACGEGIRWGYDHQELDPQKTGELWNSRRVDGQRMAAGSFIPYLWIGNSFGGLCWFADTDRGWIPNDRVPAIVVRRLPESASTDLVLNLISSDATLDRPLTVVFAFEATPVKPLPADWRLHVYDFGDSFSEWQTAEKVGSNRMQSPVPWSFDVPKAQALMASHRARGRMLSIYPQPVIPYGRHNELIARHMPEATYFGEQWNSRGSWHLFYDDSLIDYWIYQLDQWIETCGIDGYYSDNTYPAASFNVDAGQAYRLPDGRVQPGYNLFGLRRYFLRQRAVFAEHGKQGWIVSHMTHNMVMPWLGACDYALDGEDHHVTAEQNRTYLDAWPLARLRADIPRALGVRVTYKNEFDNARHWGTGKFTFDQVWRSYAAAMQLHDNLPMAGYGLPQTWYLGRYRFGMDDPRLRFIGYWEQDSGIAWDQPDVKISAWSKPGSLLLCVVGMQRATSPLSTTIILDPKRLGLPPLSQWYVYNAEALVDFATIGADGQPINVHSGTPDVILNADGTLTVTAPHHDYRNLIITTRPIPATAP